jgi:hypothetical protein
MAVPDKSGKITEGSKSVSYLDDSGLQILRELFLIINNNAHCAFFNCLSEKFMAIKIITR